MQKSPHDDDSPSNATAKKTFFCFNCKEGLGSQEVIRNKNISVSREEVTRSLEN